MSEKRRDNRNRILREGEYQRKDGRYRFRYLDEDGKEQNVYSWQLDKNDPMPKGKKREPSLREKEKQIEADLFDHIVTNGGKLTVLELVEKYVSLKTGVRHNTVAGYKTVINILKKEAFGRQRIDKVRLSDAKAWLIKLQQVDGRGYSSIHSIRGVLRPAFQMAVDDDLIRKNPFGFELASVVVNDSVTREAISRKQERDLLKFIKEDMRALRKQGPILSDNPHYVLPERMVPMATQAVKPTAAKKKRALRQNTKPLLLIALPGILYLLINNYLPMIGIFLAFKDYSYIKGPFKSNWCGFKNFEFLFRSDAAFTMIRNTLAYNVVFIITTTVLAITLAIMMNELNKLTISKFFQGSLLLPNLVSMVIVSYLVYAFLNPESGLLNNTLELLHLPTVNWYSEPKYWPMILVIVNAWKNAGYASIVYIGSIAGIDPSLYEAARIDGAGKWKQIVRVTLPQLKSTIILMTLLSVGRIFASDFGLFYQVPMDSGALYNVTQTVDTYVYRALIKNGDVGMSAAASLIQSIVGFVTVVTANWLVKKADSDSALF